MRPKQEVGVGTPQGVPSVGGDGGTESRKRILVMDDQEEILGVVESMLSYLGYEVTTAPDGDRAVALFKEAAAQGRPFDAAILDLTVRGGKGGRDTVRELVALDPQVKAVVSSGYSHDPIMDDPRGYGFSAIIAKPFTLSQLQDVLVRLLAG